MSNRDMGDEHRERRAIPDSVADLPDFFDLFPLTFRDLDHCDDHRYPCSSDQYTDTHVYAHGDAGDRAGE